MVRVAAAVVYLRVRSLLSRLLPQAPRDHARWDARNTTVWQAWAGRLEWELEELRRICRKVDVLTQEEAEGILILRVLCELNGQTTDLWIHYPADYTYEGVDLILDAAADRGVSLALADRASNLQIPYVCVSSTEGNWGVMVVNMRLIFIP